MANHEHIADDRWVHSQMTALEPGVTWQPDAAAALQVAHRRRAVVAQRRQRAIVATFAVVAVFVALPATRAFGARCVEACVNMTSGVAQYFLADEPLAMAPRAAGAHIGDIAPDVIGVDRQGLPVSLLSHRGRVTILNFWATWCAPCRQEIPVLSEVQKRFGDAGLDVIGVSFDEEGWSAITPFMNSIPLSYSIVLGSDGVADAYGGVNALPATFIIDRNGVIRAKHVGPVTEGLYDELLVKLLK